MRYTLLDPATRNGLSLALLLATASTAQDLLSVRSSDHVPALAGNLSLAKTHDFDGDGLIDIVDSGRVLWNFGGVFREVRVPATEHFRPIDFADFDGDGVDDILDLAPDRVLGVSFVRFPFPTQRVTLPLQREMVQHAIGDFDGDGDIDIVIEDRESSTPPVQFENLGGGVFRDVTAARMPAGWLNIRTTRIVPSDFDADGDLDLIVRNGVSGNLSVLVNQGGGVFTGPDDRPFPGIRESQILGFGDVDQDGDIDLWVGGGTLIVNQGGVFAPAAVQPLPFDIATRQVLTADIDNDGDIDVWREANGINIGWFENVGPGVGFVDRTGQGPIIRRFDSIATLADIDADGYIDVVGLGSRLDIHRGQPGGVFVDIVREQEAAIAYGDYDGDGLVDSLLRAGFSGLEVRLNDGGGGAIQRFSILASGFVALVGQADVDGDGDVDLLFQPASPSRALQMALNDGNGRFTEVGFAGPLTMHVASRFGDVDGDGDVDLLIMASTTTQRDVTLLLRNDGSGAFTVDTSWVDPALPGSDLGYDLADIDGDGDLDILAVGGDELRFLANDGRGNFTEVAGAFPARFPATGVRPSELRVGDVDGDGDSDVVGVYYWIFPAPRPTEHAVVFLNDGVGRFAQGQVYSGGASWSLVAFGDLDVDGDLDMVVQRQPSPSRPNDPELFVLDNDGSGQFTEVDRLPNLRVLRSPTLVDVDGDGDLDAPFLDDSNRVLTNSTFDLRLRFVPRVGEAVEVDVAQPDPSGRDFQSLFLLSPTVLPAPLVIPGVGTLTVDPTAGLSAFGSRGRLDTPSRLRLIVPSDPGLVGATISAQALVSVSRPRLTAAIRVPVTF